MPGDINKMFKKMRNENKEFIYQYGTHLTNSLYYIVAQVHLHTKVYLRDFDEASHYILSGKLSTKLLNSKGYIQYKVSLMGLQKLLTCVRTRIVSNPQGISPVCTHSHYVNLLLLHWNILAMQSSIQQVLFTWHSCYCSIIKLRTECSDLLRPFKTSAGEESLST